MIRWFLALFASVSLLALEGHAATVWVADNDKLHAIEASSNRVVKSIVRDDARVLAGGQDGALWALSKKRLARLKADGTAYFDVELKSLSLKGADYLALNGRDGAVWLAEGKEDDEDEYDEGDGKSKRVVRVDGVGQRAADFTAPGRIHALALGLDNSFWLLGKQKLWHYSPAGIQLSQIDLKPISKEKLTLLAVDSIGLWLWLAGDKQLIRLDGNAPSATAFKITLAKRVEALAIHPNSGTLWIAADQNLIAYKPDGTLKKSLDLKALGIKDPKTLTVDAANAAIWLGHDKGVTRFDLDGVRVATITLKDDVEVIGVAPFTLMPSVAALAPMEGFLTNQPTPPIKLAYGALCNDMPCGFQSTYFTTYRLSATLNGQDVSAQFIFNSATAEAILTPAQRLPEGINTLIARATDSFGHQSAPVERRFTIDTTSPKVIALSPVDGSTHAVPQITLTGGLDESATIRLTGDGLTASSTGNAFSFPLTLKPGANMYMLSLTDMAGNVTTTSLSYTLDNVAPKFGAVAPTTGAVVTTPSITITGTVDENAAIRIVGEGLTLGAAGTGFSFPVTLKQGQNTFTLTATDPAGNQATQTLRYELGAGIKVTVTSPSNGSTASGDHVTVSGVVEGATNIGVTVNGKVADLVGNLFVATIELTPGENAIAVEARTEGGATASQTLTVVAGSTPAVSLTVEPSSGVGPLSVSVTIPSLADRTDARVEIDFDGDGVVDAVAYGIGGTATYTYQTPGIYMATIRLDDFQGGVYTSIVPVVVLDAAQIDATVKRVWSGMTDALAQGKLDLALTFFNEGARERYRDVFTSLTGALPSIVASWSPLQRSDVTAAYAEYAVNRTIIGVNHLFLVYFMPDGAGVWRIDSM